MNPYEILGVSPNASNEEIKSAYRKLVKQHHPDVTEGENSESKIRLINEAYDILSDPLRRQVYDGQVTNEVVQYEESPQEVYRREYIQRKREEEQKRKVNKVARERVVYRIVRIVNVPIFAFVVMLIADKFLPQKVYHEVAELGWQTRYGGTRRSPGELFSFMQTEHFVISVPDDFHVDYIYYAKQKEALAISVTPIFKVPTAVAYSRDPNHTVDVRRTIYTQYFPWHYLLAISSLFVMTQKEYSKLAYSLCFLPALFLAVVLLIMF